jgi:hypothetical protein
MDTTSFLDYLHDHDTTRSLADALADLLVARGRLVVEPVRVSSASRRAG